MTGCTSSTKVSQINPQCKEVAIQTISPPPDFAMMDISTPIKYTSSKITAEDVLRNQTQNNYLWGQDRLKLKELQGYIKALQNGEEIGR